MYNHYKYKIKVEIYNAKKRWAAKCIDSSKNAWKVVNYARGINKNPSLSNIKSQFPNIQECCTFINRQFESVCVEDNNVTTASTWDSIDLWCPLTEPHLVYHILSGLRTSKATGSDDIPIRLLKEGALFLAEPVCHLFNSCVLDKVMPTVWKYGVVTPVPKTSPARLEELRPITLLPELAKIFERHVLESIKHTILSHIDKNQYGYIPYSSTTCALIQLHDRITKALESDDIIAVALLCLDYSKAFDTISHAKLIAKLRSLRFPSDFIDWTTSYLSGRRQSVRIMNCISDPVDVISRVPQGSIMGPLVFILYVNNLIAPTIDCIKYADDTIIINPISRDVASSIALLQNNFDMILESSNSINLKLNSSKSKLY